jgi:hypothetical protein
MRNILADTIIEVVAEIAIGKATRFYFAVNVTSCQGLTSEDAFHSINL